MDSSDKQQQKASSPIQGSPSRPSPFSRSGKQRSGIFFAILSVCAITPGILQLFLPGSWNCPLYHWFGLYCIGCGGTRAIEALLAGDLVGAFRFNPGMFVLTALTGITILVHIRNPKTGRIFFILLATACILYAILRNLPFPWVELLTPPR